MTTDKNITTKGKLGDGRFTVTEYDDGTAEVMVVDEIDGTVYRTPRMPLWALDLIGGAVTKHEDNKRKNSKR